VLIEYGFFLLQDLQVRVDLVVGAVGFPRRRHYVGLFAVLVCAGIFSL